MVNITRVLVLSKQTVNQEIESFFEACTGSHGSKYIARLYIKMDTRKDFNADSR